MIKLSVSIDVPNLQQAESFYVEALGCQRVRHQGDMAVVRSDNADLYLLHREPGTQPLASSEVSRNYERHWTPVHLDFLCDNVTEIVTKIEKFGGSHEGGESGDWGSIAYCADPFGNGLCLINE